MNIEPHLHEPKTSSQLQAMTLTELRREAEIAQHDHDIIHGWWSGLVEACNFVADENSRNAICNTLDIARDREYEAAKYYALVRDTYLSKIAFPIVKCASAGENSFL